MDVSGRAAVRDTGRTDGQFFGRQRELKSLRADIERAGLDTMAGRKGKRPRVLLIAGRPGSGRTSLADELARGLTDGYPDGVLRARLTLPGGERVPTGDTARELLGALALVAPPGEDEDELAERVREALSVRRLLLLLDDAADADQVDPLLPDAADCLVVATATGPLTGVPDVRPCTLGGLDTGAGVELLGRFTGKVRITCDPRSAEALVEECGGQPAALVLVGGWLAARPKESVADVAKQLRELPGDDSWLPRETAAAPPAAGAGEDAEEPGEVRRAVPVEQPSAPRPLVRAFRFVYESLPAPAARILRFLALAPAGLADAHTASALAGCSVSAAQSTLDDFVALGLLRQFGPQYEVPGALAPLLRALMEDRDRPAEIQLARARMLERTVRLLQSCRAVTESEGSPARKRLAGLPRSLRFPNAPAAAEWLRTRGTALLASARVAVEDGDLDTLARRLVAALVRALIAHRGAEDAAAELYGLHQLVLSVAERRDLPREKAAALLNLADLDARTGRTQEALTRYRAALEAGRAANDLFAISRAMESVGGAYQELGDWQRASDWYGRALAQRQNRGELTDEARLYGRLGTVLTYAGRYGEALRNWRAAAAGHRRLGDLAGQARVLSEAARVQEYAGRPEESLRTCREAVEWARQASDVRLQAALEIRLADTLDRLGDPAAARLHRGSAERLLVDPASAYEIRSESAKD
nr:tetratricopeptide repeat protein [Streptomyces beijiangensis]